MNKINCPFSTEYIVENGLSWQVENDREQKNIFWEYGCTIQNYIDSYYSEAKELCEKWWNELEVERQYELVKNQIDSLSRQLAFFTDSLKKMENNE